MAQVSVLKCDHCRSVVFAVGSLALHNGRAKKPLAMLDLCAAHMAAVKRVFQPGPLSRHVLSTRAKRGLSLREYMDKLTEYANKHPGEFTLKGALAVMGRPGSYSSAARACQALVRQRVLQTHRGGRWRAYSLRGREQNRISKGGKGRESAHAATT
jgi:hypothetical protein